MSRNEIYPWSLMTEVGDYFVVPLTFKPHDYVARLVSQKNYRRDTSKRFASCKVEGGTMVFLVEIYGEVPPHEFVSPEGIMSSTSRSHLVRTLDPVPDASVGERPERAKRSQEQIVSLMSREVKLQNLPWWFEGKKLQINTRIIREPELSQWHNGELKIYPGTPYPEQYDLDENMLRRSPVPDEDEAEVDVEEEWAGLSAEGEVESDG